MNKNLLKSLLSLFWAVNSLSAAAPRTPEQNQKWYVAHLDKGFEILKTHWDVSDPVIKDSNGLIIKMNKIGASFFGPVSGPSSTPPPAPRSPRSPSPGPSSPRIDPVSPGSPRLSPSPVLRPRSPRSVSPRPRPLSPDPHIGSPKSFVLPSPSLGVTPDPSSLDPVVPAGTPLLSMPDGLSADHVAALRKLSPEQLAALASLSPEQIKALPTSPDASSPASSTPPPPPPPPGAGPPPPPPPGGPPGLGGPLASANQLEKLKKSLGVTESTAITDDLLKKIAATSMKTPDQVALFRFLLKIDNNTLMDKEKWEQIAVVAKRLSEAKSLFNLEKEIGKSLTPTQQKSIEAELKKVGVNVGDASSPSASSSSSSSSSSAPRPIGGGNMLAEMANRKPLTEEQKKEREAAREKRAKELEEERKKRAAGSSSSSGGVKFPSLATKEVSAAERQEQIVKAKEGIIINAPIAQEVLNRKKLYTDDSLSHDDKQRLFREIKERGKTTPVIIELLKDCINIDNSPESIDLNTPNNIKEIDIFYQTVNEPEFKGKRNLFWTKKIVQTLSNEQRQKIITLYEKNPMVLSELGLFEETKPVENELANVLKEQIEKRGKALVDDQKEEDEDEYDPNYWDE